MLDTASPHNALRANSDRRFVDVFLRDGSR
jgi:hypothetical protein